MDENKKNETVENKENEKTVKEVFDEMTDEQKDVVYAMIGMALEENENDDEEEGDGENMKHNVFDKSTETNTVLSHADQEYILNMAKTSNVELCRML